MLPGFDIKLQKLTKYRGHETRRLFLALNWFASMAGPRSYFYCALELVHHLSSMWMWIVYEMPTAKLNSLMLLIHEVQSIIDDYFLHVDLVLVSDQLQ